MIRHITATLNIVPGWSYFICVVQVTVQQTGLVVWSLPPGCVLTGHIAKSTGPDPTSALPTLTTSCLQCWRYSSASLWRAGWTSSTAWVVPRQHGCYCSSAVTVISKCLHLSLGIHGSRVFYQHIWIILNLKGMSLVKSGETEELISEYMKPIRRTVLSGYEFD